MNLNREELINIKGILQDSVDLKIMKICEKISKILNQVHKTGRGPLERLYEDKKEERNIDSSV